MTPDDEQDQDPGGADRELILAALGGDGAARAALSQRLRCVPRILRVINSRRGRGLSSHDLEDLSQDAVIKILQKLEAFRGHTTLESWAYRFCYLEYMNRIRRHVRGNTIVATGLEEDVEAVEGPPALLDAGELEVWLDRMAPPEAEVLRLRLELDLSFAEIAAKLGAPLATIRSRYYRGIAWLRERLGPPREEGS